METTKYMRPSDVVTYRTTDPKQMFGKWMPHHLLKTWNEDFIDNDTGETVSIERNEVLVDRGYIDQSKLQQIMFFLQSGDAQDVEICDHDLGDMVVVTPKYMNAYVVEMGVGMQKQSFACYAQTIPQAIRIASEFGQVYRGFEGWITAKKVVPIEADMVPDNHECIPEQEREPAEMRKDYFKVTTRTEWFDDMKEKTCDHAYIIASNDVGQAKERVARLIDIFKAKAKMRGDIDDASKTTYIRKAVPFTIDCVVPREFSEMYHEEPTAL